jgi:hypothetical protein
VDDDITSPSDIGYVSNLPDRSDFELPIAVVALSATAVSNISLSQLPILCLYANASLVDIFHVAMLTPCNLVV